jgi:hypothetical protein
MVTLTILTSNYTLFQNILILITYIINYASLQQTSASPLPKYGNLIILTSNYTLFQNILIVIAYIVNYAPFQHSPYWLLQQITASPIPKYGHCPDVYMRQDELVGNTDETISNLWRRKKSSVLHIGRLVADQMKSTASGHLWKRCRAPHGCKVLSL